MSAVNLNVREAKTITSTEGNISNAHFFIISILTDSKGLSNHPALN